VGGARGNRAVVRTQVYQLSLAALYIGVVRCGLCRAFVTQNVLGRLWWRRRRRRWRWRWRCPSKGGRQRGRRLGGAQRRGPNATVQATASVLALVLVAARRLGRGRGRIGGRAVRGQAKARGQGHTRRSHRVKHQQRRRQRRHRSSGSRISSGGGGRGVGTAVAAPPPPATTSTTTTTTNNDPHAPIALPIRQATVPSTFA
jgi:hypothetical protein